MEENQKHSSLKEEVGGDHYVKMGMQPLELIVPLKCNFIQGCIIKYISRYKKKNGEEDIRKCIHYARLASELGDKKSVSDSRLSGLLNLYINKNKMTLEQRAVITAALHSDWFAVEKRCYNIIYDMAKKK